MAYSLLWLECLAVSLLFAAMLVTFSSRASGVVGTLLRAAVFVLLGLIAAGYMWVAVNLVVVVLRLKELQAALSGGLMALAVGSVLLAALYCLGAAWLMLRGWRRIAGADSGRAAAWSHIGLAAAFVAALVLQGMTFASIDLAVQRQLAELRAEAEALARSAIPQQVPGEQNAAELYWQVFRSWGLPWQRNWPAIWHYGVDALDGGKYTPRGERTDVGGGTSTNKEASPRPFDFASAELADFLHQRAGELAMLRRAAARPSCTFNRDSDAAGFATRLPEDNDLRTAARLLAVDARYRAAAGELDRAVDDVRAIFGVARHVGSQPFTMSFLTATAIERMAVRTLQHVLQSGKLNDAQLERLGLDQAQCYHQMLWQGYERSNSSA